MQVTAQSPSSHSPEVLQAPAQHGKASGQWLGMLELDFIPCAGLWFKHFLLNYNSEFIKLGNLQVFALMS